MNTLKTQLKAWVLAEAERTGLCRQTVYWRIRSGRYPWLKLEHKNRRVIFVLNGSPDTHRDIAQP